MSLLRAEALSASYGDFQALFGVDFTIEAGEIVALIGANGAGKSTFLKTLCGLLRARQGAVWFDGQSIAGLAPGRIVARGLTMVPEGRRLFPSLSVEENLLIGAHSRRKGPWNLAGIYRLFPVLGERRHLSGAELSGGEQQIAAIGRALMSNPKLLLCDEISLGLAPIMVKEIYEAMIGICARGLTVILVEQDVSLAQRVSQRLYCFSEGRVTLAGPSAELTREQLSRAYFGV
jgi:branched-chain amino acid transport system ATP-binding protein